MRGKTMFRKLAVSLAILLATAGIADAGKANYVASKLRAPFHILTCSSAMRITADHAVYYETREQAIEAGHRPCKRCKP